MKVRVDSEVCVGHGRCYALAPTVYGDDDQGHCVVIQEEVSPDLAAKARQAADNCPEGAIQIEED